MTYAILCFDAPMMSFGAPIVSEEGRIQSFPSLSMLTGLLANAFGYDRREAEKHEKLQGALQYAVREDETGKTITDYQTVDLGSPHMIAHGSQKSSVAWTTWGHLDQRAGGSASKGTAQRKREYWAGAVYTVALRVDHIDCNEIGEALTRPARPLFIGRKCCVPAERIFRGTVDAPTPQQALLADLEDQKEVRIWYEVSDEASSTGRSESNTRGRKDLPGVMQKGQDTIVTDARDWTNQLHVGERLMREVYYRPCAQDSNAGNKTVLSAS